jgi:hypothetical protein
VRASVSLGDVVGKAQNFFIITVRPLQGDFHANTVCTLGGKMKDVI